MALGRQQLVTHVTDMGHTRDADTSVCCISVKAQKMETVVTCTAGQTCALLDMTVSIRFSSVNVGKIDQHGKLSVMIRVGYMSERQ